MIHMIKTIIHELSISILVPCKISSNIFFMCPLYKILPVTKRVNSWNRKCVCLPLKHITNIFSPCMISSWSMTENPKNHFVPSHLGCWEWRADVKNSWHVIVACEMQLWSKRACDSLGEFNREYPQIPGYCRGGVQWVASQEPGHLPVFTWAVYHHSHHLGELCY